MVFLKFLYLVSLSIWFGSLVFFSFVGAPAIFKSLPRGEAGDLVGVIFPRYYMLGLICGLLALGSLLVLSMVEKSWQTVRIILLILMVSTTLYAAYGVGPKAKEVKAQIRVVTDESAKQALQKQFGTLHQRSVFLNSLVLIAGVVVIFLTAYQIKV
jgi:hypothetical protein